MSQSKGIKARHHGRSRPVLKARVLKPTSKRPLTIEAPEPGPILSDWASGARPCRDGDVALSDAARRLGRARHPAA